MASFTKLNIVALVFIFLLSVSGALGSSASWLHQREKQNSRWFSDCRNGYRKLGFMNCEDADVLTNVERVAWSQSLRKAFPSPPPPVEKVPQHYFRGSPPPPYYGATPAPSPTKR